MMQGLKYRMVAEFIGTFAIVLAGCGSIMIHGLFPQSIGINAIPIIFGLAVMVMIYAIGHISGAHFNPAVTLAFSSVKRFSWKELPYYWFAQISAGITAIAILSFILPPTVSYGSTTTILQLYQAVIWEIILTFFLMFVIISVATDSRAVGIMAGAAIGGTVMLGAFVGGALTGASMNPARSIAPALFEGNLNNLWVYIISPCIGAVLAAFVYEKIRCEMKNDSGTDKKKIKGCC